jgi:hypothetical protein
MGCSCAGFHHRAYKAEAYFGNSYSGNQYALRRLSRISPRVQFQLRIGAVNDPLEAEADRVADEVMRMPDPVVERKCAECEEEDARKPRTKSNGQSRTEGFAPPIVHQALNSPGQPLDRATRAFFEPRFGADFSQVSVHTGDHAAKSAQSLNALAYSTGPHIMFGAGLYAPDTDTGRHLIAHELAHVVQQGWTTPDCRQMSSSRAEVVAHLPGVAPPSADPWISVSGGAAERRAPAVSAGSGAPVALSVPPPVLLRQGGGLVPLADVTVNLNRVTVPPQARLSFSATVTPANASGVTLSIVGDNAQIAAGTTISNTSGAITVDQKQTGGSAHALATQNATDPSGATITNTATAPFNFTAIPSGITSTTASPSGITGMYGGDFTHTFTSPAGGQTALEMSHVNEQFAGVTGTTLTISGSLGTFTVTVNNPNSPSAGWDLDSDGEMTGVDQVTWSNTTTARPFVRNASNPTPKLTLPQAATVRQNFRNLSFPSQTYGTAVTSTTHRRALEDRSNSLKGVTSAGVNQEVVEDYAGPTVFRGCSASPASIPITAAPPPGGQAPAAATSTITVAAEGQQATPTFSIRPPDLGCTITPEGVLTPGTTQGTVTIRAGDAANFDETTVTLTAPPAPTPNPNPNPPTNPNPVPSPNPSPAPTP